MFLYLGLRVRVERWTRRLILLAAATGAVAIVSVGASRAVAQTTAPTISVDDARAADLLQQVSTLSDSSSDSSPQVKARDEAARRIVSRRSAEGKKALLDILVNAGNPRGQLAVAKALADDGATDPAWIDPLFALIGQDRALSDAACGALANYKTNGTVLNRLSDIAQNSRENRENARAAAARALGSFADKNAAKVLVALLQNAAEPAVVHNAAADALVDLTGLTQNDRDSSLWAKWWQDQSGKSDALFRDDVLMQRSALADHWRQREDQVAAELKQQLNDQYANLPDANKDAVLLKWMTSAEPEVRALAAEKVVEDFNATRTVSSSVNDQLRKLIGDSSPAVRLQVAHTLHAIPDKAAIDALLTQLSQEPVAENKVAIASALSQMRDLRAVPELEKLLADDQPMIVTQAAAEAFSNLGSTPSLGSMLYEQDPAAATRIAEKLNNVLIKRTRQPGTERLREAVVVALVPLRDPAMLPTYFKLLNMQETDGTRRAALRGIGELRSPVASDVVVDWLKTEPVSVVRKQAITTLELVGGPEQFETLYQLMQPSTEKTDDESRAEAWRVFSVLLPKATTDQVNRWTGRFPNDPQKRVTVLKVLADKFEQDKNYKDLAETRQSIGEAMMKSTPAQPDEAAKYFQQALDYYQQNNYQASVIVTTSEERLDALLQSKQYTEAADFGSKMIATSADNQQSVGSKFKTEADSLINHNNLLDAQRLISAANKMTPALEGHYKDLLNDVDKDLQQRLKDAKNSNGNGTMGPKLNPDIRIG